MRKKIWLGLVSVLLLVSTLIWINRGIIEIWGASWYAKGYAKTYFRHQLTYEKLTRDVNGALIVSDVKLQALNGKQTISIPKLIVDYEFDWGTRKLAVRLDAEHIDFDLVRLDSPQTNKRTHSLERPYFFVHPSITFQVHNGVIHQEEDERLSFRLKGKLETENQAQLKVQAILSEPKGKELKVAGIWSKELADWKIAGEGTIPSLRPLFAFTPDLVCLWKGSKGDLSCRLRFFKHEDQAWKIDGVAQGNHLEFSLASDLILLSIDKWESQFQSDNETPVGSAVGSMGKVSFQHASLSEKNGNQLASFSGQTGIETHGFSDLQAKGTLYGMRRTPFSINGNLWIEAKDQQGVSLEGFVGQENESSFAFQYQYCGCESSHLQFTCEEIEAPFLTHTIPLLQSIYSNLPSFEMNQGVLSVHVDIEQQGDQTVINLVDFQGKGLDVHIPNFFQGRSNAISLIGKWNSQSGSGWVVDHCDCQIDSGEGLITNELGFSWNLSNIDLSLFIRDGIMVSDSHASLEMGDLVWNLALTEQDQGSPLRVRGEGQFRSLVQFFPSLFLTFPEGWKKPFLEELGDKTVVVSADLFRDYPSLHTEGMFTLKFENSKEDTWKFSLDFPYSMPWSEQFQPYEGLLQSSQIALQNYISTFPFYPKDVKVSGICDLCFTFGKEENVLYYHAADIEVNHPNFSIQIPYLQSLDNIPESFATYAGVFRFGSQALKSPVSFIVDNAKIFHLASGFEFTSIHGQLDFSPQTISSKRLESIVEGALFQSGIQLDLSRLNRKKTVLEFFDIHAAAKPSHLNKVLSKLGYSSLLTKIPVNGSVVLDEEESYLRFLWNDGEFDAEGFISGALNEGSLSVDYLNATVHDLSFSYAYSYPEQVLKIDDMIGSLQLGPASKSSLHALSLDHATIPLHEGSSGYFDLWIGDLRMGDLARAAGSISHLSGDEIEITFDPSKTHFRRIYPQQAKLSMNQHGTLHAIDLLAEAPFDGNLSDLKEIVQLGLVPIPSGIAKKVNSLSDGGGKLAIQMKKKELESPFEFDLWGKELQVDGYKFSDFSLSGFNKGEDWSIERFAIDGMTIAMDLKKEDRIWSIPFFGLQIGQSVLMGSEGTFDQKTQKLEVGLNLVEIDWEHMSEFPPLQSFVSQYTPKGQMKAKGSLSAAFIDEDPGWMIEAEFRSTMKNFSISDIHLYNQEEMQLSFRSNEGLEIQPFSAELLRQRGSVPIPISVNRAGYHLESKGFWIDELNYRVQKSEILPFVDELRNQFDTQFIYQFGKLLQETLLDEELNGSMNLYIEDSKEASIYMKVDDAFYQAAGYPFHLKSVQAWADPMDIHLVGKAITDPKEIGFVFRGSLPKINEGELVLFSSSNPEEDESPLLILWEKDDKNLISIQQISGRLSPFTISLKRSEIDPANRTVLTGRVQCSCEELSSLGQWIYLKNLYDTSSIAGELTLNGLWKLDMKSLRNWSFAGDAIGTHLQFGQTVWDRFSSEVLLKDDFFQMSQFELVGSLGQVGIQSISFQRHLLDRLDFDVNEMMVEGVHPGLFQKSFHKNETWIDDLFFETIAMERVNGSLAPSVSIYGKGELTFGNQPLGILSDRSLIPVGGQVDFQFLGNRLQILELKDVVSNQKMVRYRMAKNPSFIGLDGSLNLNFQVQPYQMLTPISKLLSISIRGSVAKPTMDIPTKPGWFHAFERKK